MKASVIIPYTDEGPDKSRMEAMLAVQTCRDFESIFIHDAERRGPAWARNRGLERATGEVILFADVDDEIAPTWIEKMVKDLGSADMGWRGDADVPMDLIPKVFGYRLRDLVNIFLPGGLWKRCHREMSGVWNLAVRREALGDVRFDESLRLYEDAIYISTLAMKAKSLAKIGDAGYVWRPSPNGTMARGFSKENLVANKFAVRDARRKLDPKMSHWRGSYLLSAAQILRLKGLRAAFRYLFMI